jgi:hypothetical protein
VREFSALASRVGFARSFDLPQFVSGLAAHCAIVFDGPLLQSGLRFFVDAERQKRPLFFRFCVHKSEKKNAEGDDEKDGEDNGDDEPLVGGVFGAVYFGVEVHIAAVHLLDLVFPECHRVAEVWDSCLFFGWFVHLIRFVFDSPSGVVPFGETDKSKRASIAQRIFSKRCSQQRKINCIGAKKSPPIFQSAGSKPRSHRHFSAQSHIGAE